MSLCIGRPSLNEAQSKLPHIYKACFEFVKLVSKAVLSMFGIPPYTLLYFCFVVFVYVNLMTLTLEMCLITEFLFIFSIFFDMLQEKEGS